MVLGCPIIETSALKGTGLKELIVEAVKVAKKSEHQLPQSIFSEKIEKQLILLFQHYLKQLQLIRKDGMLLKF